MKNEMYYDALNSFAGQEFLRTAPGTPIGSRMEANPMDTVELDMLQGVLAAQPRLPDPDLIVAVHPYAANSRSENDLHRHTFFELLYMFKGTATQYFLNGSATLREGCLCLLNPNIQHGVVIDGPSSILFNIIISPELLTKGFFSLITQNSVFENFFVDALFGSHATGRYILFDSLSDSRAEEYVQSLIYEYIRQEPCYTAAMRSYLSLLFTDLLRHHLVHTEGSSKFSDVIKYISENLSNVTLSDIAKHFNYSVSYLSHLFRQNTGQCFGQIVRELKLVRCADMLSRSAAPIDSVVELMGYYDRSYFNKVFKKRFGVSPQAYRNSSAAHYSLFEAGDGASDQVSLSRKDADL